MLSSRRIRGLLVALDARVPRTFGLKPPRVHFARRPALRPPTLVAPPSNLEPLRAFAAMSSWKKMTPSEVALAKQWHVDGESTAEIAERLGRNQSSITRLLVKRLPRKKQGRKSVLQKAAVDKLEAKLQSMILKADGKYVVTVAALKRATRTKASKRTVLDALHKRGVYFRRLREKPVLTDQDIRDRKAFAERYQGKSASWWNVAIHMSIDVKHFQVLPHGHARRHAAQEVTRGAYRKAGQGLDKGFTKPPTKTKFNTGAKGVKVLAGIGKGRVLLWEYLDGGRWSGQTAAEFYKGPIAKKLKAAFPARSKYVVLEDNDPSGFKSKRGLEAKREAKITTFDIPKRSPCLNVCDYFLWSNINRRMREQERSWPPSRKETREEFLKRLRKTAMATSPAMVRAAVGDMKRRCARLLAADGGNFEEGGSSHT